MHAMRCDAMRCDAMQCNALGTSTSRWISQAWVSSLVLYNASEKKVPRLTVLVTPSLQAEYFTEIIQRFQSLL
jgi:hypothetical protein